MNPNPAVLALVPDAYGGRGGIAQYNRDFLSALSDSGVVSSITILPRHAPDCVATPAGIHQMPAKRGRIAYSIEAARIAAIRQVDIVFCGHLFMAPLAAFVARIKKARLIVQAHGIEAWPKPPRVQRAALERADLVLCVSRYTRGALLSWASIAPERVLVLPNTVREAFTPGDASKLRAQMPLEEKRVLLTVGRMHAGERYKGHDRVIAAISDLVAKGYDICYLVVGEGSDRARLEALAHTAGVNKRVHFLGAVALQELIEAYRMADLFVMPSAGEGFGIAFLEAMACGTPALGLAMGGAKDALADGRLGSLVSEVELPSAIAHLLSSTRPEPVELARATRALFGRPPFVAGAQTAFGRLMEST